MRICRLPNNRPNRARRKLYHPTCGIAGLFDTNLTFSRYSHTLVSERAAALVALPDVTIRPDRERATGADGESLVSSLVEQRASNGSSHGIEAEPDTAHRSRVNDDQSITSDRSRQRMTQPVIEVDGWWRGG